MDSIEYLIAKKMFRLFSLLTHAIHYENALRQSQQRNETPFQMEYFVRHNISWTWQHQAESGSLVVFQSVFQTTLIRTKHFALFLRLCICFDNHFPVRTGSSISRSNSLKKFSSKWHSARVWLLLKYFRAHAVQSFKWFFCFFADWCHFNLTKLLWLLL